jgi:hypothetical protein
MKGFHVGGREGKTCEGLIHGGVLNVRVREKAYGRN